MREREEKNAGESFDVWNKDMGNRCKTDNVDEGVAKH